MSTFGTQHVAFARSVKDAMQSVLGAMVSDDYPGNPDYITTDDIDQIAEILYSGWIEHVE